MNKRVTPKGYQIAEMNELNELSRWCKFMGWCDLNAWHEENEWVNEGKNETRLEWVSEWGDDWMIDWLIECMSAYAWDKNMKNETPTNHMKETNDERMGERTCQSQ